MPRKKKNVWNSLLLSIPLAVVFLLALIFYPADARPAVAFHQDFIEGSYPEIKDSSVDLNDVDRVFALVFSALRDEARVYPTENYYYFVLKVHGKEVWGNIHFPPTEEIRGNLDFAYWIFENDPAKLANIFTRYKNYGAADGVSIQKLSDLRYAVGYHGKSVVFSFNDIPQSLPSGVKLKKDESLAERTFDESGYQFLLIYNKTQKHFMFVLDESRRLPESLSTNDLGLWIGERSGFVFYQDVGRKVLVGVRSDNVRRNNYFDGPFDQLADNFVRDGKFSEYLQAAYPYAKGRLDKYGRFTDADHSRLALTPYDFYSDLSELSAIIKGCRAEGFYSCITYDFKEASQP